jgi:hypothetical protein
MLGNLGEQVRKCLEQAEDCARKAAAQPDRSPLRRDFLDMEHRWLSLARGIEHTEQITRFSEKAPNDSSSPKSGFLVDPQAKREHPIPCRRCQSPMTWFAAKLANDGGSLQNNYECDSCGFTDQTTEKRSQSAALAAD